MSNDGQNPFWRWSLEHYADKRVERMLLRLQDDIGFDVNVVLWCCWRAQHSPPLDEAALNEAIEAKREWTAGVVHPLRAARRYIKIVQPDANDDISRLRERIKVAELEAEKHVQNLLFALAPSETARSTQPPEQTALCNLNLYAKLLGVEKNPAFSKNLLHELVDNIFETTQNVSGTGLGRRPGEKQDDR
ncbi:TIGR02444 family protein [Hyphococcus sp.]|uniref:TIGR02444 family protein n=1 Tax=Hyphococcus sp. TaxID=2038636 RepID=UPI003CCBB71B